MIIVDPARACPLSPEVEVGVLWCHMVSDHSTAELHNFARRLGIKRRRHGEDKARPRYIIPENLRRKALRMGAVESPTTVAMINRCRGKTWDVREPTLRGCRPCMIMLDEMEEFA